MNALSKRNHGYTLVELTVVVFLIGIMLSLAVPRIQDSFLSDDRKSATRRFVGKVRELQEAAVRDKKGYRLHLDISADRMWETIQPVSGADTTVDDEDSGGFQDAEGDGEKIAILDVEFSQEGKTNNGEVIIHFTKEGYVEPAVIHLGSKADDAYTVHLSPFLGVLDIYDEYVERQTLEDET